MVCFAHSIFQLLNSIPHFVTSVISKSYPTCFNFALDTSLKDVIESMNGPSTISKPINLVYHIRWMIPTDRMRIGSQQDAHEFVIHLLYNTTNFPMKNLFRFEINESVICSSQECRGRECNNKTDPHFILSFH